MQVPTALSPATNIVLKAYDWHEYLPVRVLELILAPICNLFEASDNDPLSHDTLDDLFAAVLSADGATPNVTRSAVGTILQQLGLATYDIEAASYGIRADVCLVVRALAAAAEIGDTVFDAASRKLKPFVAELWSPNYAHYSICQVLLAYLIQLSRQIEAEQP